jgi:hypothetical protein
MAADIFVPPPEEPVFTPPPPPPWSGVIGVYGGVAEIEDGDDLYRVLGVTGMANVNMGGWGLQFGGAGETGLEEDAETYGGTSAEAHLYMNSGTHKLGGFGGVVFDQFDDDWVIHGVIGLEGAIALGTMASLHGQVGWIDDLDAEDDNSLQNALFARAIGSLFLGPNTKLQAEVAYYDGVYDGGDDFSTIGAGVEIEHSLGGPVSVFASADAFWHEDEWGNESETYAILGGVRANLGQPTLADMEANGVWTDLPDIARLNAVLDAND